MSQKPSTTKKLKYRAKSLITLSNSTRDKSSSPKTKKYTSSIIGLHSPKPLWLKLSLTEYEPHPITLTSGYQHMRAQASKKAFVPVDVPVSKRILAEMLEIYGDSCDGYAFFLMGFLVRARWSESNGFYQKAIPKLFGAPDAGSLYALGYLYLNGLGVEMNFEAALHYYQRAVALGHVVAMNDLGYIYRTGSGVRQDYALALHYYQTAADKGDALSQFNTGTMYLRGWGLSEPNKQMALEYFRRSALQGDQDAKKEYEKTIGKGG